jgi:hypothetical protein
MEQFCGHLPQAIHQEFWAAILLSNLHAQLVAFCSEAVRKATAGRYYEYKTNYNVTIGLMKSKLVAIFLLGKLELALEYFIKKFTQYVLDMFNKQSDKFQLYFIEFILLDYIELLNNSIRYKNRSGHSNPLLRKVFILYNYIKIIKTLGINFEKELISLESRKIIENNSSSKELLEMDNIIKKHLEIFPDTYPL